MTTDTYAMTERTELQMIKQETHHRESAIDLRFKARFVKPDRKQALLAEARQQETLADKWATAHRDGLTLAGVI
jgi:hypothetical protein